MNLQNYSPAQLKVMACLAYYCLTLWQKTTQSPTPALSFEIASLNQSINAAGFCAANIGIKDSVIWEIRSGNIKGLQNLNRIATTVYFEDNYTFDCYCEYGTAFKRSSTRNAQECDARGGK